MEIAPGDAKLMLRVEFGHSDRVDAWKTITGPFVIAFEPVNVCSDPLALLISKRKSVVEGSQDVAIIARRRKRYADMLAKELAAFIYSAMQQRDTYNGYPIEPSDETHEERRVGV